MKQQGVARSGELDVAYTVEGEGPEAVLLIMGLGQRSADWGPRFVQALGSAFRVIRFDNRGTGQSGFEGGGFSLEDMAGDAIAVLDAVGVSRAHVVGFSMGGMIAQLLAIDHPDRVGRLVLMSTHFGGPGVVGPTPAAQALFEPAEFHRVGKDPAAMMRRTVEIVAAPGFAKRAPEAVDFLGACAHAEPTRPSAFMAQMQAILMSDRAARLAEIAQTTMVIHGDQDSLIPVENGRMLADKIPGAKLVLLEDCGHFPMHEQPVRLETALVDFLAG